MSTVPSNTTLLNLIEEYKLTVRPEFIGGTAKVNQWVVYTEYNPSFMSFMGHGNTLMAALLNIYAKLNKNNVEYTD